MEEPGVDEIDRDERQSSSELIQGAARHDLPLCPNRLITVIEAVRGAGFALELLRERLHLRPSAGLAYSAYAECYFLQLDDVDRFENKKAGMLDAVSTMPFRSSEIFRQEISTWTPSDISRVVEAEEVKALIELGLVSPAA
ncbi:hypothetical protein PMI18_01641 [Pseudomonas sp. GM102]|uniref:hypothetical protein n=1 Tax=Pseudomonas sp. GM102 TaxID=1144321 RepID=UPI00026FBD27|nr:hypothetical protein [Pseudomonas sp. GM102]EJM03531.1 hypothetical protein PMI18_01641 [Pseudomonas sp. GM102]